MTFQHIITVSDRNASKRGNLQQVINTMSKMSKPPLVCCNDL